MRDILKYLPRNVLGKSLARVKKEHPALTDQVDYVEQEEQEEQQEEEQQEEEQVEQYEEQYEQEGGEEQYEEQHEE